MISPKVLFCRCGHPDNNDKQIRKTRESDSEIATGGMESPLPQPILTSRFRSGSVILQCRLRLRLDRRSRALSFSGTVSEPGSGKVGEAIETIWQEYAVLIRPEWAIWEISALGGVDRLLVWL